MKPTTVLPLLQKVWAGSRFQQFVSGGAAPVAESGNMRAAFPSVDELKAYTQLQLQAIRDDHLRPLNPTPYKVSVGADFYRFIHELWEKEAPVPLLE